MFNFVKEALDQMAFFVHQPIAATRILSIASRRNDWSNAFVDDGLNKVVAIITFISQQSLHTFWRQGQQALGLVNIAGLTGGQDKVQGISQRIGDGMDFGGKTASGSTQGLGLGSAVRCASCTRMGTGDSAIDQYLLQIGILTAAGMQTPPDILFAPPRKAFKNRIPFA
jgi:hypothetical protein